MFTVQEDVLSKSKSYLWPSQVSMNISEAVNSTSDDVEKDEEE